MWITYWNQEPVKPNKINKIKMKTSELMDHPYRGINHVTILLNTLGIQGVNTLADLNVPQKQDMRYSWASDGYPKRWNRRIGT